MPSKMWVTSSKMWYSVNVNCVSHFSHQKIKILKLHSKHWNYAVNILNNCEYVSLIVFTYTHIYVYNECLISSYGWCMFLNSLN